MFGKIPWCTPMASTLGVHLGVNIVEYNKIEIFDQSLLEIVFVQNYNIKCKNWLVLSSKNFITNQRKSYFDPQPSKISIEIGLTNYLIMSIKMRGGGAI